jgi:hypothetical protein
MNDAICTRIGRGMEAIVLGMVALSLLAVPAGARDENRPPRGFKKVSNLVDLPSFMPGLGILYVKPETLPAGPFLAYDRAGRRVSTIYMIPVEDVQQQKKFDLAGLKGENDHVSLYFNPGHPGVETPHYHVVIWHVNKRGEARVAR